MTLALLLTAVTGAWAQEETLLTTITPTAKEQASYSTANVATVSFSYTADGSSAYLANWGWWGYGWIATVTAAEGYTITKCIFYDDANRTATDSEAPFVVETTDGDKTPRINGTPIDGGNQWSKGINKIEVYGYKSEPAIDVKWNASTKTGTFTMPGSDVVLTPIYAKAAAFATTGTEPDVKTLLPEAAEGVIAGTDASLIAEGTGIVAFAGTSTEVKQGTLMYAIGTSATEAPALDAFSADVPTAKTVADAGDVYVWYYIKGADTPQGQTATAENTFNDSEICAEPIKVTVLSNKFNIQFTAANANTIEAGKATVTVGGTDKTATVTEGKLEGVKMGSEVKVKANTGYKFRKVEVKKGGGEPVLLTTITAADNSSFKSGSQTFGDVATVTLTGNWLTNDGSHGGWYCTGSNLTATISVAEANGANITSVKFYTAGGGSAEDKDAPFEVTTTSMSSSNITTYLNGNSIGSYGVSKIEVYGTK